DSFRSLTIGRRHPYILQTKRKNIEQVQFGPVCLSKRESIGERQFREGRVVVCGEHAFEVDLACRLVHPLALVGMDNQDRAGGIAADRFSAGAEERGSEGASARMHHYQIELPVQCSVSNYVGCAPFGDKTPPLKRSRIAR